MSVKDIFKSMMAPPERKLFAAGMTALAISAGFVLVVYKIDAKGSPKEVLDAYSTACEWLVYLFAAFAGGNALTWWTQKGQSSMSSSTSTSITQTIKPSAPVAPPAPIPPVPKP